MSTEDIKTSRDNVSSLNTAMTQSKKGIVLERYEKAVKSLSATDKKIYSLVKTIESKMKRLEKTQMDIQKKLERLDDSPGANLTSTVSDITTNIEELWNAIDKIESGYGDEEVDIDKLDVTQDAEPFMENVDEPIEEREPSVSKKIEQDKSKRTSIRR